MRHTQPTRKMPITASNSIPNPKSSITVPPRARYYAAQFKTSEDGVFGI
jgi:hypothetical protein